MSVKAKARKNAKAVKTVLESSKKVAEKIRRSLQPRRRTERITTTLRKQQE